MKTKLFFTIVLLTVPSFLLYSQTIIHSWHVIDRGGGKSYASGIILQASIGQPAMQAMSASGTKLEGGYIPCVRVLSGTTSTLSLLVANGWNMISVPLLVTDYQKSTLYPTATSPAYNYNSGYHTQTVLQNGAGYWLKFPSSNPITMTGTAIQQETVAVFPRWNMIGTPTYPVLKTGITAIGTTVQPNFYGYSSMSGYFTADTLIPGRAYWAKVSTAGKLVLPAGSLLIDLKTSMFVHKKVKNTHGASLSENNQEGINELVVKDAKGRERTLYFSSTRTDIDADSYELPPLLSSGMFDIRYASQRCMEIVDKEKQKDIPLLISSSVAYPLTIGWKIGHASDGAILLVDGKTIPMKSNGEIQITNLTSQIRLRLLPSKSSMLPKDFALYQNYPNPFNPTTTIRYALPQDAHVNLIIYDVIGQEVKALIDEIQDAGFKTVEWNATNKTGNAIASGVYFYRLTATSVTDPSKSFVEVKKMLLLK